jgi:hypothetical protein
MVIVHQSENASAGRLRARRRFLVLIYATAVVMCRGITCCSARFSFADGLTLALTRASWIHREFITAATRWIMEAKL